MAAGAASRPVGGPGDQGLSRSLGVIPSPIRTTVQVHGLAQNSTSYRDYGTPSRPGSRKPPSRTGPVGTWKNSDSELERYGIADSDSGTPGPGAGGVHSS